MEERYQKSFKKAGTSLPKLGMLYVASAIEEAGYDVRILDAQLERYNIAETTKAALEFSPDIIGITTETANMNRSRLLAEDIKRKKIPIVFGGPHPTLLPHEVLSSDAIDFVVIGEGEVTIVELLNVLNMENPLEEFSNIKGIGFKKDNQIVLTERRDRLKNLDSIKFPARHLIDFKRYHPSPHQYKQLPVMNMTTSRGCPFTCSFCSSSNIWEKKYIVRSVDNVIEEIVDSQKRYGIKEIAFWDDIWGISDKWIEEFCDRIIKEKINVLWSCECRVDTVTQKALEKMAEAGCWKIFYGIETLDEEILAAINKKSNLEKIYNAVQWTKKAGIEIHGNFILGLPKETPEKVRTMVKRICTLPLDYAKFNVLTPYPGTVLYKEIKDGKWGKYIENFDKLTLHHVTFIPFGYTDFDELDRIRKYALRKFYFRFRYIAERVLLIRTAEDVKRYYRGFQALLG